MTSMHYNTCPQKYGAIALPVRGQDEKISDTTYNLNIKIISLMLLTYSLDIKVKSLMLLTY
jgi:hypothetical protein